MKLKALTDMSLRRSPDPKNPQYEEWFDWKEGEVFDAPLHLNTAKAIARGIAEKVTEKKAAHDKA